MSAFGPKQTWASALHMSAFGGKADMALCGNSLLRSLLGVKRTWVGALHMSAFDPKRTSRRDLIGARFDVVIDYFVIMRLADGGASPGAAGEMTNVSQAFQPSALFCAANSP